MSMWIVHFEKRAVHVVVDSVGSVRMDGKHQPQMYTAKMNLFPHLGCVMTGRGDSYYFQLLNMVVNRLPMFDFDDVAGNLKGIACQTALLHAEHAGAGWAPPIEGRPSAKQELMVAGYSKRNRRPELHCYAVHDGREVTNSVAEGTWLGPDIAASRGIMFKPRIKAPVVELAALARKQLSEAMTDPDVNGQPVVGGQIVHVDISADSMTTRVIGLHKNHAECVEGITNSDFSKRSMTALQFAAASGWPEA